MTIPALPFITRPRRCSATNGRARLELRGLDGPHGGAVYAAADAALKGCPGVTGTSVDPSFGRVVVAYDPELTSPGSLACVLDSVESELGLADEPLPQDRGAHPADSQVTVRQLAALTANGLGVVLGVATRLVRSNPLPLEVASLITFVDNQPRLRRLIESGVGTGVTDMALAVGNAFGLGLAQGPFGLITDSVHRGNLLAEETAVRQAFQRADQSRWDRRPPLDPEINAAVVGSAPSRPVPLRPGPIEQHADRAGLVTAAVAAATQVVTGAPRRAGAMIVAGIPKAGRMGRDAFAAHLARSLAQRDIVVLHPAALRKLDRVDTVVIDGRLAATSRWTVTAVRANDGIEKATVHRALARLFDGEHPGEPRRDGDWELSPLEGEELGLRRRGELVAEVTYEEELSGVAQRLVRRARRRGHMVVFAGDDRMGSRLGADLVGAGGQGLAETVTSLQTDGCVLVLVAAGGRLAAGALQQADVGVEITAVDGSPWTGDVIGNRLADALRVVDTVSSAEQVSRHGTTLALSGSALGGLLAASGTASGAASRAARAVNVAALVAMANGVRVARTISDNGTTTPQVAPPWHQLETDDVLKRLASNQDGLDEEEARARRYESDVAAPVPSLWRSIGGELVNPLTPVLAGGAIASAAVGSVTDAALVAGVTLLNSVIGGAQRFQAERAMQQLDQHTAQPVLAVRGGAATQVPSEALVPGDVICLRAGDVVPADCRLLDAGDLEVDESPLTGESEPVSKDSAPVFASLLAERSSMVYEGTTIVAGEASSVVAAVGPDTAARRVGDQAEARPAEGVEGRLRRLTAVTLPVSLAGGVAMLASGLLRRRPLNQSVGSAVALAVASVPEGLPLLATMAQLASARRLSRRGALVRNPRAVEALGRVAVVCTDKTGTLTEGRIRLVAVTDGTTEAAPHDLAREHAAILGAGLRATPPLPDNGPLPHLTDQAVLDGATSAGVPADAGCHGWSRVSELPFEPGRSYHAVLGRGDNERRLTVKGAPEVLMPRCRQRATADGPIPFDDSQREQITDHLEQLAGRGLRVLAVAERHMADDTGPIADDDAQDLTFLGFLALSDPVRPTAAEAVQGLRRAGVEIVMVTGDHPLTARGIASELGILNGHAIVTGTDMADMDDTALDRVVADASVFARVTPADKVRIVEALQRNGRAVAMTGDGANDAPAIRLADAGIALGSRSTAAARDAADLVVTDDRIETIVDAIIEGRAMWSSVREALAILLGGNLGEVAFTVISTLVTGRAPLSARQLLAVNLLTDVAPALAIAVRQPPGQTPDELVNEGPDTSLGRSLERAMTIRAVTTASGAGSAWIVGSLTGPPRRASTMALVALVGTQLGQTVVSGGLDPLVLLAAGGSALLLVGIVQTPGLSRFFGCTPLDPLAWLVACTAAAGATSASAIASWLSERELIHLPTLGEKVPATAAFLSAVTG